MAFTKQFRVLKIPKSNALLVQHKSKPDEALLFDPTMDGSVKLVQDLSRFNWFVELCFLYDCFGLLDIYGILVEGRPRHFLMSITDCKLVGELPNGAEVYSINAVEVTPIGFEPIEHEFAHKSLRSGVFYFAVLNGASYDLTICAQKAAYLQENIPDIRFLWNRFMYLNLYSCASVSPKRWLLLTICGSILIEGISLVPDQKQAKACLISRISCERAGTSFSSNGVNDDGQVANWTETEQVIFLPDGQVSSYIITSGSVPLFWGKMSATSKRIRLFCGKECSQPAFDRHLSDLKYFYGMIAIVNLLGSSEEESQLATAFKEHFSRSLFRDDMSLVNFDYSHYCSNDEHVLNTLFKKQIDTYLDKFSFYHKSNCDQQGTFRVNSFDGLKRITRIQFFIASQLLERQLQALFPHLLDPMTKARFIHLFPKMWQEGGIKLCECFASSASLQVLPKSFIGDQLIRYICLLPSGMESLLSEKFARPIVDAYEEYTAVTSMGIAVGSWNIKLDGGMAKEWQWEVKWKNSKIDLFAIGLQNVININQWETHLETELATDQFVRVSTAVFPQRGKFTSPVCMFLFAKLHLVRFIRDVVIDAVMVNKLHGGVAIRLRLYETSIAFVCSHYVENPKRTSTPNERRNTHLESIDSKLFRKTGGTVNYSLRMHEYIFWFGNLNYTLNCTPVHARDLSRKKKWKQLAAFDQLKQQMNKERFVLRDFVEGEIQFEPTYLPREAVAWPDRILFKKRQTANSDSGNLQYGNILWYDRAGQECSNLQRPLIGEFEVEILRVIEEKREQVMAGITDHSFPHPDLAKRWSDVRRISVCSNKISPPMRRNEEPLNINKVPNYNSPRKSRAYLRAVSNTSRKSSKSTVSSTSTKDGPQRVPTVKIQQDSSVIPDENYEWSISAKQKSSVKSKISPLSPARSTSSKRPPFTPSRSAAVSTKRRVRKPVNKNITYVQPNATPAPTPTTVQTGPTPPAAPIALTTSTASTPQSEPIPPTVAPTAPSPRSAAIDKSISVSKAYRIPKPKPSTIETKPATPSSSKIVSLFAPTVPLPASNVIPNRNTTKPTSKSLKSTKSAGEVSVRPIASTISQSRRTRSQSGIEKSISTSSSPAALTILPTPKRTLSTKSGNKCTRTNSISIRPAKSRVEPSLIHRKVAVHPELQIARPNSTADSSSQEGYSPIDPEFTWALAYTILFMFGLLTFLLLLNHVLE